MDEAMRKDINSEARDALNASDPERIRSMIQYIYTITSDNFRSKYQVRTGGDLSKPVPEKVDTSMRLTIDRDKEIIELKDQVNTLKTQIAAIMSHIGRIEGQARRPTIDPEHDILNRPTRYSR